MKTTTNKTSGLMLWLLMCIGWTAAAQVTVTPVITPPCHSSDGAVTFNLTGGGASPTDYYTLYNNGTSLPTQTSPTFTGLSAGSYYVYIYGTDSGYLNFTISPKVSLSSTVTNTTCPTNAGSIVVTPSGGTAPYSYAWNTGATSATISSLSGGTYRVTVSDANGCSAINYDTVVATSPMTVTISNNGVLCGPTLTGAATGGSGAVTYAWSTGATGAVITISSSGTYVVTATDAQGCTAQQQTSFSAVNLYLDSGNVINAGCNTNNGSITVHMINGTSPYTFHWSNGGTDSIVTGLAVGGYGLTVTDANGCSASNNYTVGLAYALNVYLCGATNPTCGASDGILSACPNGGTSPYSYNWSNGGSTTTQTGLPAGSYTVTVTDPSGCSATATHTLIGIATYQVNVTTTPTSCSQTLPTGTATAIVTGTGGTAPYSYTWYNYYSGTLLIANTQTITNLAYNDVVYVVVTDANGCQPNFTGNDSVSIRIDPSCFDHITGYAYADANANCTFDNGELPVTSVTLTAVSSTGQTYYANPDTTGFYDFSVLPDSYTVTYHTYGSSCFVPACTSGYTASFTATGQLSSGNNFAVTGSASYNLGVHMGYQGAAPGTQREYWVYYYNWGQTSVANGVLTFIYDPNITFASATPTPTTNNASTHTLTWDITNNLAPMTWLNAAHQVVMYFDIPATLPLGTLLTAHADISPTAADCDSTDNSQNLTDVVSGSHDPNEKEVSPAANLTASDTVLTYTLRFQNNGNAPASIVVIKDTLSANVNPASVVPGASNHNYKYALSGNGIITFTFENINLPDSTHGDSSKGFVMYTVHTKKNLPLGTQVKNTAYIYFDINPAVVTNTTRNYRSDFPAGIRDISNGTMTAQIIPNPAHDRATIQIAGATGAVDLQITDALGQIIFSAHTDNKTYALDASGMTSGIYFYTAKDANGHKASGKISVVH
jgi:uncharacterized repeat protein (TIGR01451 family)